MGAILTTAVLGLIVSLSTFLVIGATSSVTFNVVRKLGRPLVNALLNIVPMQVPFHSCICLRHKGRSQHR